MASGPRKATALKQDLPPVIRLAPNEYGYLIRYRIISEDRNRFSAWSPVDTAIAFDSSNLPNQVAGDITMVGTTVFVTWDDELDRPKYDIFVSENGGPFVYHGTSPIHSYSIIRRADVMSVDVKIQIESINKEVSEVLTICELYSIMES